MGEDKRVFKSFAEFEEAFFPKASQQEPGYQPIEGTGMFGASLAQEILKDIGHAFEE